MQNEGDIRILHDLAKRYAEVCRKETYEERRRLWRDHNSLIRTRPLIYVRWLVARHEAPESRLQCQDPSYPGHETFLRQMLFQDTIEDDTILEPWITQRASCVTPPEGVWGVPYGRTPLTQVGGSWKYDPPLKRLEDISKLVKPRHVVNEEATAWVRIVRDVTDNYA